jgi:flagellar basal body-associated protein FliL
MFESPLEADAKTSRSRSIMIVAITAAVFIAIIAGVFYVNHHKQSGARVESEPYRPGSPPFDSYAKFIDIEQQEPQGSENMLRQVIVVARAILQNRGDKTLTQIEVRAVVYDQAGNAVADRKALPVPKVRSQLGPGESMLVQVNVDSVPAGANPSAAIVLLSGLRLKEASR